MTVHEGQIKEYNKRHQKPEMTYIDYGLSILSTSILENHTAQEAFDLADLYYSLSMRGELTGYEVFEPFYEIGPFQGLHDIPIQLEGTGFIV